LAARYHRRPPPPSIRQRESLFGFGRIEFALPEMETINKAAYWDYQRERVYVKSANRLRRRRQSTSTLPFKLRPNATIDYPRPSCCPDCKSKKVYGHDWRNKIIVDLRFMKHGIKRWITRYVIHRYRCQSCGSTFSPSNIRWTPAKYGPDLVAYTMYLNIELGLPQLRIDSSISKLFGLRLPRGWSQRMKATTAESYRSTYDNLLKKLSSGCLLHVDETSISVRGASCYVWVLASLDEVAYFYTSTKRKRHDPRFAQKFLGRSGIGFLCSLRCYQLSPTEMPYPFHPRFEQRDSRTPLRCRTQAIG
jgi:predicted Zn-ribbon and HTH transcriptional regulator